MAKKSILKTSYSFNFYVIGIISRAKDYTVSWAINEALGVNLKKKDDLKLETAFQKEFLLPHFMHEDDYQKIVLIPNKIFSQELTVNQTVTFIPSLSAFDFILKIEDLEDVSDMNETFDKLKKAGKLDSVVKLDISKIKEKDSFIF